MSIITSSGSMSNFLAIASSASTKYFLSISTIVDGSSNWARFIVSVFLYKCLVSRFLIVFSGKPGVFLVILIKSPSSKYLNPLSVITSSSSNLDNETLNILFTILVV